MTWDDLEAEVEAMGQEIADSDIVIDITQPLPGFILAEGEYAIRQRRVLKSQIWCLDDLDANYKG